MGEKLKYYKCVEDNGIIYSCDMLRLKFHIHEHIAQTFLNYLNRLELRFGFNMEYSRPSFKVGTYKYLFSCKYDDFVFVIGCCLILPENKTGMDCFVEFNPNKCDMDYMRLILERISYFLVPINNNYFRLIRFDLAVDLPFSRSDVVLVKEGKRDYCKKISSSVTEYLGARNSAGFVKLYDKTKESDLNYDLTRLEITLDSFEELKLPSVYVLSDSDEDLSELNNTDKVMIRLLRSVDYETQQQCLKDMGRNKREKLKEYIFPRSNKFVYNYSCIDMVILEIMEILCVFRDQHLRFGILSDIEKKVEEGVPDDEIFEQLSLFD